MRIAGGEVVAQRYQLDAELARGGMGSVWRARHRKLGTSVAVKFMDPRFADAPAARVRFEREARAAAALRSEHVVRVFDYGIEDGTPFLVMELLEGEDLGARLSRTGPFPAAAVADVLAQVARALRLAHEAGIVHRDLKPGNVFMVRVDGGEVAKVLDFGLAKSTEPIAGEETTRAEDILGSPQYMSPEQTRESREADPRSDLWSLGVIAYRLLTGRLPFTGQTASDILVKVCTEPALPPSRHLAGLPPAIDRFFERALAKDPALRFQSAPELAQAFAVAAGLVAPDPTLVAAPVAPAELPLDPAPRPSSRSAAPMLIAVGLGLAAVVAGVMVRARAVGNCSAADPGACRTACLLASPPECLRWHEALCETPSSPSDPGRAEHCEAACKEGRTPSCAGLAGVLALRLSAEPEASPARAALEAQRLDALDRGCEAGDRAACVRFGTEGKDARALAALERMCTAQVSAACPALAARLAYGYAGLPGPGDTPRFARDVPRALSILGKGCEAGVLGDCEDAATLLLEGDGVPRDEARARALYEKAATGVESPPGAAPAERAADAARRGVGLAWMLDRGRGGPRDPGRAVRSVTERCGEPGAPESSPAACLELAFLIRTGRGISVDAKRSEGIVRRVCSGAVRCADEARRWEVGWLRPKDRDRAGVYYEMACKAGEAAACARPGTRN